MGTLVATAARRLLANATHGHGHGHGHRASSLRPGASPREPFPMLLPVFILFVLLLCFLSVFLLRDLLHFFSLWLRRRRRLRADADATPAPHKPAGLDPAVLATFPTVRWLDAATRSAPAHAHAHAECAVCLSEFAAADAVRLLTVCRHAFHTACIDSWLGAHTTCPVCRSELDAPPPPPTPRRGDGGRIVAAVDGQGARTAAVSDTARTTSPANGAVQSRPDR